MAGELSGDLLVGTCEKLSGDSWKYQEEVRYVEEVNFANSNFVNKTINVDITY